MSTGERFDPGVNAWLSGLGLVRDAVRQELVRRQLAAHLSEGSGMLRVLDAGCGQGTQAIALARIGHQVVGVDLSEKLLAEARRAAADEPGDVRHRLEFVTGDLLDLGQEHLGSYDLVCCHGVAMYLPSLDQTIAALCQACRAGGLISVLTRNRAGIAMRAGMAGDWEGALRAFDARYYENRLGIEAVRADEPREVQASLLAHGASVVAWYGVRLFTDHWGRVQPGDDFAAILSAEEEAGRRDPYRSLAALTHTIGRPGPPAAGRAQREHTFDTLRGMETESANAFSEWPVERLEVELCSLAARVAAATCVFLLAVAEYDRRRAWEAWECRDMAAWLSWKCGIAPVTAREQVRVARALLDYPLVRSRFREGRLSYSQVRAIVRSVTRDTEAALVELAEVSTAAQLETVTRAFRRSRRRAKEVADAGHAARFVRYGWDEDGNLVGSFCLPADEGAAFVKAIEDAVPAGRVAEGDADGARDAYGAVRADAMVELVSAGARRDVDDDLDSGYLLTVVTEASVLEGGDGDCSVVDGPGLAAETVQRLACDAAVVTVVEDEEGNVLDLGRRTRKPNRALRRAMRRRDGHCQFPGCESRRVQAHHMLHWPAGGRTSLVNLVSLCRFHHRRVHEGRYRLLLDEGDGRHFYHPAGYELPAVQPLGPADTDGGLFQGIHPYKSGWDGSRLDLGLTLDCLHQHTDSAESAA